MLVFCISIPVFSAADEPPLRWEIKQRYYRWQPRYRILRAGDLNRDQRLESLVEIQEGLGYASLDRWESGGFGDHPIWERRWPLCGVQISGVFDREGDGYEDIWVAVSDGDSSWIEVIGGAPGDGPSTKMRTDKVPGAAIPASPPVLPHRPALHALAVIALGEGRAVLAYLDYDRQSRPRAIVGLDATSGRLLWSRPIPGPISGLCASFGGDGTQPIFVGGIYASGNPIAVDTMNCGRAYLFALDGRGEFVWLRSFPHLFTGWHVRQAPWDPEGSVLAWKHGAAEAEKTDMGAVLLVERDTGRTRRHFRAKRPFTSLITVDLDRDEGEEIVLGNEDGIVRVLDSDLNLVADRSFEGPVTVWGSADFTGDGKPELCATTPTDLLVLDTDLVPLAQNHSSSTIKCEVIEVRGNRPLLLTEERPEGFRIYSLEKRRGFPPRLGRSRLVAVFLAGIGFSGLALLAFRVIRGERARREETLWRDLRSFTREWNHGKCASNVTDLRDFIHDEGWRNEEGIPRFHEDLVRFQETSYPILKEAHRCARSLNLPSLPAMPKYPKEWQAVVEDAGASAFAEAGPPRSVLRFLNKTYDLSQWLVEQVRRRFLCDVESEIPAAVRALGSKASLQGVRFRLETESRPSRAYIDALDFRLVVENLVKNALAAMQGTSNKEIAFLVRSSALGVEIFVQDTGPGVPAHLRERLFEEGVTGTPGGSGQGLRQCREILDRYRGTIALAEGEGRETCFRIRLQPVIRRRLEGERE